MSIRVDDAAFEAAMNELARRNSLFSMWFGAAALVVLAGIVVALGLMGIDAFNGG